MKALATLASLLALTSVAAAESYDATQPATPANTYVAVDTSIGVQRSINAGVGVNAGHRINDSSLFLRGALFVGYDGGGTYQQARVGVETRGCGTWLCAFAGVDTGYQHDHMVEIAFFSDPMMETNAHDLLLVPRAGLEVGKAVKVRLALEAPYSIRLDERETVFGLAATGGIVGAF